MGKRRKGREVLLQAGYASRISGRPLGECLQEQMERRQGAEQTDEFARALADKLLQNEPDTATWLGTLLQNWSSERVGVIERVILQMALTELRYCPEVPWRVAINEACELARRFCSEEAVGFVNGILDEAARQVRERDARDLAPGGPA